MSKFQMVPIKVLKKMEKGRAYDLVLNELPDLVNYYFRYCIPNRQEQDKVFMRMKDNKNYARYIKHALKEDSNPFPDGFNFIMSEFITKFGPDAVNNDLEDVCAIYSKALEKMCKGRAKKIAKDLDIPKDVALEFAIIYPGESINKMNAWAFNRVLTRKLQNLQLVCCPDPKEEKDADNAAADTTKVDDAEVVKHDDDDSDEPEWPQIDLANRKFIKKLYKRFFGDDLGILISVYSNLMLDRVAMTSRYSKNQKRLFDVVTEYLLDAIEALPSKAVGSILHRYVERRQKDRTHGPEADPRRRVVVSELTFDRTPKMYALLNPKEYGKKTLKKLDKKAGKKSDKKKGKKKH